jgi:hypothetical protein
MLTWEIRNSSSLNIKEFQGYAGIVGNLVIENGGFTKIFKSFKNLFVVLSGYGDVVCASRVAKSYGFGCGRPNYCAFAISLNIWEFVIIHQWASRNFKDYLQQYKEARRGMLERKVVSECFFFKGFLATEVFFAFNFFEFSEECGIAGYGDLVIAAVLQGDGDSRFWLWKVSHVADDWISWKGHDKFAQNSVWDGIWGYLDSEWRRVNEIT